jgi:hypothetical protein
MPPDRQELHDRRPPHPEPTRDQIDQLDKLATTLPSPKEKARALFRLGDGENGMSDAAIHDDLLYRCRKDPPSVESIREYRGWWRIFGEAWPDAPVTFLRSAEVLGRRLEGLEGVHDLDEMQAKRVLKHALPLIAEGLEKRWTTRVIAHVVGVRTRPAPVVAAAPAADAVQGEKPVGRASEPVVPAAAEEEPGEPDPEPAIPDAQPDSELEFCLMLELSRQLVTAPVPGSVAARRQVMDGLAVAASELLGSADSDRERCQLVAALRSRLDLDDESRGDLRAPGENPDADDNDPADESDLDDLEFDS